MPNGWKNLENKQKMYTISLSTWDTKNIHPKDKALELTEKKLINKKCKCSKK